MQCLGRWLLAVSLLSLSPATAHADERDYCPARPGLGTPACTTAPGHVSVETGLADWQRDADADQRTDTLLIGDTLVRIGLNETIEAQIGWTPFGHVRARDKATGTVDRQGRVGDALLGIKANLRHPDGRGLAIALQPFVTVPVGRGPVGAGDWGAGLVAPVTWDLSDTLNLEISPEIDASVDADGNGRHLAYSGTVGLGLAVTDAVTGTAEVQAARDEDPSGRTTGLEGSVSIAWMAADDLQFDIGGVAGLNRNAPDAEVYVGVSRRF